MLTDIKLENFKCFSKLELTCRGLNLLCGLNGMGKSSVFQSLLVLKQSFEAGELQEGHLVLVSDFADIGTGVDILYEDADEDVIRFALKDDTTKTPWTLAFEYSRTSDQLIARQLPAKKRTAFISNDWQYLAPFGGPFTYVNAERIGPRKLHSKSETHARRGQLGARGEYAINFLNENAGQSLAKNDPRLSESRGHRLVDVIEYWLQEITPGAHIELESIVAADSVIAGFTFDRQGDVRSNRYRSTNVGFGLSYVLPVLVALLAPKGTLVLLENPEAHLHPRGQTRLGELSVLAAAAGVQLFVETHSDHFMDGVRIAVRDKKISNDDVAFHYFSRDGADTNVVSPALSQDGRLDVWPEGFFDQRDENLSRLIAPKK